MEVEEDSGLLLEKGGLKGLIAVPVTKVVVSVVVLVIASGRSSNGTGGGSALLGVAETSSSGDVAISRFSYGQGGIPSLLGGAHRSIIAVLGHGTRPSPHAGRQRRQGSSACLKQCREEGEVR
jgi:hypothetical protein